MAKDMMDEYFEVLKKQWAQMGLDPEAMMKQVRASQEMAKGFSAQMAQLMGAAGGDSSGLFNDEPPVNPETDLPGPAALKAVACGANLAYLNLQYLNTLKTFRPADQIEAVLESDWSIGSPEALAETLEWLDAAGHRAYFDPLWKKLKSTPVAEWALAIENVALLFPGEEPDQIQSYASNLVYGYDFLKTRGFFKEMAEPSILSWDLGRSVNLCRWGHDAGFLSREDALQRILASARVLRKAYPSWRALSEGYLLGFAMWTRNDDELETLLVDHEKLLTHPKSPWVTITW
jgi:hypothetical protein